MPRRPLHAPALRRTHPFSITERIGTVASRLAMIGGAAALSAWGVREMYFVLAIGTVTPLQWTFLALFAINFAWIAQAAIGAVLGIVTRLTMALRGVVGLRRREADTATTTAVLIPVYNEAPERIAALIDTLAPALARLAPGRFACFVLSDSNRADAWIAEEAILRDCIEDAPAECPVHYRRRADNAERKAGNIADWVERFGGAFEAMIVLDADSLVRPETLITLSRRLAAEPDIGLIQTLPTLVRARTLHARLQQFANQCYGAVSGAGLSAWYGRSGNFWGHNAILRTEAFADSARLPVLAGDPPFGGAILSHDFVEAALLRRRGWGVRFDADLPGSHEEAPPSIDDVIVRDRRWCQGNLQHARLLFARGIAFTSRLHLLTGIMAYASAGLWFALVVVGLALGVQAALTRPEYFAEPGLFPTWPVFDAERAVGLFAVSMIVVLLPKVLGWLATFVSFRRVAGFGGPIALTASVLVEVIVSALYAPIMMVAQTRMLVGILTGVDAGWNPQRRDAEAPRLAEAVRAHRSLVALGIAFSALSYWLHEDLFLWLLPVTAGLMLAPLLSWVSGMESVGRALGALALLRTPGERRQRTLVDEFETALAAREIVRGSAIDRLAEDGELRAWHVALLPTRDPARFDADHALAGAKLDWARDRAALVALLTPAETMALVSDADYVRRLPSLPATARAPRSQ